MNILIITAHPSEKSFNHALFESVEAAFVKAGHSIKKKELYKLNFNTVFSAEDLALNAKGETSADVQKEQADVSWAELLVFIHPVWWYGPPAILKGWIERVLTLEFGFTLKIRDHNQRPKGLLTDKKAIVIETTASDKTWLNAVPYHSLIKPTLEFCGIKDIKVNTFYAVPYVSDKEREDMLKQVQTLAASCT